MDHYDGIVEINDCCYLDTQNHALTIQLERVSITLHVEEFLDFYEIFENAKSFLKENNDVLIKVTEKVRSFMGLGIDSE